MKGPRDLKRYVAKYRDHLKACRWDDLYVMKLQDSCKKWFKRKKNLHNPRWRGTSFNFPSILGITILSHYTEIAL